MLHLCDDASLTPFFSVPYALTDEVAGKLFRHQAGAAVGESGSDDKKKNKRVLALFT